MDKVMTIFEIVSEPIPQRSSFKSSLVKFSNTVMYIPDGTDVHPNPFDSDLPKPSDELFSCKNKERTSSHAGSRPSNKQFFTSNNYEKTISLVKTKLLTSNFWTRNLREQHHHVLDLNLLTTYFLANMREHYHMLDQWDQGTVKVAVGRTMLNNYSIRLQQILGQTDEGYLVTHLVTIRMEGGSEQYSIVHMCTKTLPTSS